MVKRLWEVIDGAQGRSVPLPPAWDAKAFNPSQAVKKISLMFDGSEDCFTVDKEKNDSIELKWAKF
jgi:hypothetical protein